MTEVAVTIDKDNTLKITVTGMEDFPVTATYDEVLHVVAQKIANEVQQRIWNEQRIKAAADYNVATACVNLASNTLGAALNTSA